MSLRRYRKKVADLLAKRDSAAEQVSSERLALAAAKSALAVTLDAQQIVQQVAQVVQQQAHKRISSVVTRCLEAVFDEPYRFKISFEKRRGKTEAVLAFRRRKMDVDPMSAAGGGVIDVAAMALRLACLALTQPKLRPLLVLDEPFRFLSEHHRPRVRAMLETLSQEMGIQFILVTHCKELETGKVISLSK